MLVRHVCESVERLIGPSSYAAHNPKGTGSMRRLYPLIALIAIAVSACGQPAAAPTPIPTQTPGSPTQADLGAIKAYLVERSAALKSDTLRLRQLGDEYYLLAEESRFDYRALVDTAPDRAAPLLRDARAAWLDASPRYEQIEGIVAGVPSFARFDLILDAGSSGAEGGDNIAPIDLTLPDGTLLTRPGNLFGVTESALWGTEPAFSSGAVVDIDGGGIGFGDLLPDARVLKAAADALDRQVADLSLAALAWEPTDSDAFTALVTMIPTMSECFDSWKNSRFVRGDDTAQRDFVAISRLADMIDILSSLQIIYQGVSPLIASVDADENEQLGLQLSGLRTFIADIYAQEQTGKRFTPEEADLLGAEAQNRASMLAGRITQIAARLQIELK
jgi:Imelysin